MQSVMVLFAALFAFAFAMPSNRMNNNMNGNDGQMMYDMNGMPYRMNSNGMMMYDQNGYPMNGNRMNGMMMTSTPAPFRGKRGADYYNRQRMGMNGNQMPADMQNDGTMQYAYDDGQMYTMPYYYNQQQRQQQQMGMNRNGM